MRDSLAMKKPLSDVDKGLVCLGYRPGPVRAGFRCRYSTGFLAWAEALTVAGQRRTFTGLPPFRHEAENAVTYRYLIARSL